MAKLGRRVCRNRGGTVTVQGAQTFDTLQFTTDGYILVSGTLLSGPGSVTVNVDGGVTV